MPNLFLNLNMEDEVSLFETFNILILFIKNFRNELLNNIDNFIETLFKEVELTN